MIYLLVPLAGLCGWMIAPCSTWRRLIAWQFRTPTAVEPSEDGNFAWRVAGAAGLFLPVITAAVSEEQDRTPEAERRWEQQREQQQRYESCLLRYGRDSDLTVGPNVVGAVESPQPFGAW